jgi:Flp pilus assembly CpaF family ATPase
MATVLRIAARCRLNIVVSGGTGSGKTTMLNALSGMIENGERVVTIEDAAELRLQQPHVVRLETRPPTSRATARSTCATSSRTRCACGPTASSWARCAARGDRPAAGDEHRP